jgi:transcriptional regulator with XRE-family HTH domain
MGKQMLYRVALGQVLRDERQAQGLTLRQVSGRARVALGYLSEIERGAKELSSELLDNLADLGLGVDTSEMVARASLLMFETSVLDTADDFLKDILQKYSGAKI